MTTFADKRPAEEPPAILEVALFAKDGESVSMVETCATYDEAVEKAGANEDLIVGFINHDDRIWKLPDCWVFLDTGEVRAA